MSDSRPQGCNPRGQPVFAKVVRGHTGDGEGESALCWLLCMPGPNEVAKSVPVRESQHRVPLAACSRYPRRKLMRDVWHRFQAMSWGSSRRACEQNAAATVRIRAESLAAPGHWRRRLSDQSKRSRSALLLCLRLQRSQISKHPTHCFHGCCKNSLLRMLVCALAVGVKLTHAAKNVT